MDAGRLLILLLDRAAHVMRQVHRAPRAGEESRATRGVSKPRPPLAARDWISARPPTAQEQSIRVWLASRSVQRLHPVSSNTPTPSAPAPGAPGRGGRV